jgi:phosphatidate phosphatase PAH1
MKYMRKGAQKNEKKKAMGGYGKIKRKGGTKAEAGKDKSSFGMLSVKAGIDNNPKPTAADRIAGAKKGKRAMAGQSKDKPKMSENAAKRVSKLSQKKAKAEEMGKTKKAGRVQKRIARTTRRSLDRNQEGLKSMGIQPSNNEVSFNKPEPTKARYGAAKPKAKKKKK